MRPEPVIPVKYFVGALFSDEMLLKKALEKLENVLGPADFTSEDFPFDVTDYYNPEMGSPIFRRFISFPILQLPNWLADAKLLTNAIEDELAVEGRRKVNLDIGYIDYDKVVLGSAKYCGNKVYLNKGIYADMALKYAKGAFTPYSWAFMDFKLPRYYPAFFQMRIIYKSQVKPR